MMNMSHTVKTYKRSCAKLQERIDTLTLEIARLRMQKLPMGNLVQRRHLLYTELAEMQGDLRMMEEYLNTTQRLAAQAGVA